MDFGWVDIIWQAPNIYLDGYFVDHGWLDTYLYSMASAFYYLDGYFMDCGWLDIKLAITEYYLDSCFMDFGWLDI